MAHTYGVISFFTPSVLVYGKNRDGSLLTLDGARDVTVAGCAFRDSAGGGVRADGVAQRVNVTNNTFARLGLEAVGVFGLGLGVTQVTSDNAIARNDISATGLVKFDAPALVVWNAARTAVRDNYVHDTSARALYVGGSRYCTQPEGFATDGGIEMNVYAEVDNASNVPAAWRAKCNDTSYGADFYDDCACSYFRGAHGTRIVGNVFARVTTRKDRTFFSDGVVYVSGPGYVADPATDVTVFEDNSYLASPGEGATSFRMLYVDGYTGSMNISRNAVVGANAYQGFMLCNWYGASVVHANALQLGDASWGADYEIQANCDGNPIMDVRANLVLSDEDSPTHEPDATFADDYARVYDTVCAASVRAAASVDEFLEGLNDVITQLGGTSKQCDGAGLAKMT